MSVAVGEKLNKRVSHFSESNQANESVPVSSVQSCWRELTQVSESV